MKTVALRGAPESELLLVRKALSFAVLAACRLLFENAFLRDTLSISTLSTAAFGVEGLPDVMNVDSWRPLCRQIVQTSTRRASIKRRIDDCIDCISPHVTNWTVKRAHGGFKQVSDYRHPRCKDGLRSLREQQDGLLNDRACTETDRPDSDIHDHGDDDSNLNNASEKQASASGYSVIDHNTGQTTEHVKCLV